MINKELDLTLKILELAKFVGFSLAHLKSKLVQIIADYKTSFIVSIKLS